MTTAVAKTIRRRTNSDIEAGYSRDEKLEALRAQAKVQNKTKIGGRADLLAGDSLFLMKWEYKDAMKHFPSDPYMRYVDRYYPYANGGPLLVDEPSLAHQEERSERKRKILKDLGYRFIVLKPSMTEVDELMELERCG